MSLMNYLMNQMDLNFFSSLISGLAAINKMLIHHG